jgi:lipopolysaccharide export system protein LptA
MRFVAGDTTAEAQRARFIGETRVELRGGRPEIREPERTLIADEIDVVTEPRQVTGRGSARTRFVPTRTQAGPFASGEPVQVASAQALLREKPRGAEFTGGVIARQNERALSSQSLVLEDAEKSAHAEGSVSLRSFRIESSAAKPPIAPVKIPVQIDSDRMVYSDASKTSRFDGHALYREPLHRLSADSIATTGESSDHPSEITAEGTVRFEGEGRTGRSDAAVYRSEQKTIVLTGKTQPAEVRETATGRTWQGPALTCVLTADSIPVVTGDLGRSKIFGTVAEPGREQVGQPTHRRKPR